MIERDFERVKEDERIQNSVAEGAPAASIPISVL